MARYFPSYFDIQDRPVLIVGGGELARRKARLLLKGGADLRFVAVAPEAATVEEFPDAAFLRRAPEPSDFADAVLAVVATGDEALDEAAARLAKAARTPANVVDRPELCDFVVPSIVDRGDVVIGISTGGAAPVLGRNLRAQIEALLPARLGVLVDFAKSFRGSVAAKITDGAARKSFWESFFKGPIAERVLAGDETAARDEMLARVNGAHDDPQGVVHIVGAGPGDPELLTLKALRILQEADVIVHDKLVSDEILGLARRDAERVYVGKSKAEHTLAQEDINTLLVRLAKDGKRVVRLKGGDPFIFGRGGEELEELNRAGVEAFVVPGVTAAIGAGASAQLPLTHRDYAQAVTFVTGHGKGGGAPDLDWESLAALKNTLVIYMGVSKAEVISAELTAHGRAPSTPVAIVENATRPEQIIAVGELGDLGALVKRAGVKGPAVLVIGEVARLAQGAGLIDMASEMERLSA